jgi:death-on-curing protein
VSRYLSVNEVIEINAKVVRKFGGIHGLRDSGALQSALGRLESGYYNDAIEEAAALFESLSQIIRFWMGTSVRRSRQLGYFFC